MRLLSNVEGMNQLSELTTPPAWTPHLVGELSQAHDLPTAASMLAAHRVPIFPCVPEGKRPLTRRGFQEATSDVEVVENWWRRWPDANIAVPTGFVSGLDVVDVDVHPSGSGFQPFADAQAHGLADQWAWLVRTPSGGLHAYYLRTTPGEQRSWQVPHRHIDFRGDGGYIVVPPSRTDVGDYRVIAVASRDPKAVDGPALRNFLDPPRATPAAAGSRRDIGADHLATWVANQPEGARNRSLFWAACRMVESGHDYQEAASTLGTAAQAAGLDEREAMTTIRSAFRSTAPGHGHRSPPARADRPTPSTTAIEGIGR